jgi:hypothetical protein
MSFDSRLSPRWNDIIRPGIEAVQVNGAPLRAVRVDTGVVSDSILTEILTGISMARLIFGDVTALDDLNGQALRNANVFYEIGLAHAMRRPEEVLLFRSDNKPLMFDVANVRVNPYDPDNDPKTARTRVTDAIVAALNEGLLSKSLAVQRTAESLDYDCWSMLIGAQTTPLQHPTIKTFGHVLASTSRVRAISRLLELGAIRTSLNLMTPEMAKKDVEGVAELVTYSITPFGHALFDFAKEAMGLNSPDRIKLLLDADNAAEPSDGERR